MSPARITGAIVAIIAAGLLAWVIFLTFGPEEIVAPTVKVSTAQNRQPSTAGHAQGPAEMTSKTVPLNGQGSGRAHETAAPAPAGKPSAEQVLAARTQLMRFRTKTGEGAFPQLAAGNFHINTDQPQAAADPQQARKWLADKPGGDVMRDRGFIAGISSLPYKNAANFQQPQGRFWRSVHNDPVRYGGGWLIFGIVFALAVFLFVRGRVRVEEGFSGVPIRRFNVIERTTHWMTASSFVVMGFTGLIILYGKPLLIPLIGEGALGAVAYWSAWLHMAFAGPFVLGIVMMIGMWIAQNLPTWVDWEWLKQGGGMIIPGKHPPAYRFNAGQKILYWLQISSGLVLLWSGLTLMFPFYWFGYSGMQAVQLLHVCVALLLIALIIGHIYIGSIGMEGAFDAMWSGDVDRNWAKEHHSLWYERITGRRADRDERAQQPAE